ncbi:MAG: metallophosphatase [Chitinophagales bacterium]
MKHLVSGSALIGLGAFPREAFAAGGILKLTILHSNDVHSRVDPFPDDDKKYPGMGGMARKAALIKQIRSEEQNVLLLDSGDIFQGTPYFNFYHGALEMQLMQEMGYHAATMGNHDFDAGIDGFAEQLQHAQFPIIISNYDFTNTAMQDRSVPWKIFYTGDIKVGVFGLGIELKGLVPDSLYGETKYIDPISVGQNMASFLKYDQGCDYVICLSHLGYAYKNNKVSDIVLAAQTRDIDLILGGHTHTFLDAPVVYKNLADEEVVINQVGWAGVWLGRIDVFFERKKAKKWHSGKPVIVSKKTRE